MNDDTPDERHHANARAVANLCRKYIANGPDDLEGAIAATERGLTDRIASLQDALAKANAKADQHREALSSIGDMLPAMIRASGKTDAEVSDAIPVDVVTVSRWRRGSSRPAPLMLRMVIRALFAYAKVAQ